MVRSLYGRSKETIVTPERERLAQSIPRALISKYLFSTFTLS